jgi:hypothetical protein
MRRPLAALLGVTLLLPVATSADGAVADKPRYKTYVVCSAKKSAEPAKTCGKNKLKTAVFLSKDEDVTYKVCVKFPGKEDKLCAAHQPATEDVKSGVSITANKPGTLKATWYVGGDKVGTWSVDVE